MALGFFYVSSLPQDYNTQVGGMLITKRTLNLALIIGKPKHLPAEVFSNQLCCSGGLHIPLFRDQFDILLARGHLRVDSGSPRCLP